jgi:tRNA dimethylallyltransferase
MIAEGLLEEVRSLRAAGYGAELKSMQSLGYRHFQEFLSGDRSIEQTVSDLKRDTRRFAKRQISWFNADPRVRWIDVGSEPMAKAVAEHIDRSLRESGIHLSFVDGKKE